MQDDRYCYPDSEVLINKLDIRDEADLFTAEKELTFIRIQELQENPIIGAFDFAHLKRIHEYIFQDLYTWAGKIRTVEIGKGNMFCTTACIDSYADSVFGKYYKQCRENKNFKEKFITALAENYGDLNALHPFREGNGRTQREFARLVCLDCGYVFDLSCTSHDKMLQASRLSFDKADSSQLCNIFREAVVPIDEYQERETRIKILTSDDLRIKFDGSMYYEYYKSAEVVDIDKYNLLYEKRTQKNMMEALGKTYDLSNESSSLSSKIARKQGIVKHRDAVRKDRKEERTTARRQKPTL